MAILKPQGLESFLRRDARSAVAVLFYGPDSGAIREHAAHVVRTLAGSLDDPFTVVRLTDAALSDDRGRLSDEAFALPFLGGTRVVWIEDAGSAFLAALELLLARQETGNLIVAEASNLAKTAKLRSVFESSPRLAVMPCYEDAAQDLNRLIADEVEEHGLSVEMPARQALLDLLGADRRLSRQELAKLALYCLGRTSVRLADVEAVCGDASEASMDEVLSAAFTGDVAKLDTALTRLRDSGTQAQGLLAMAGSHTARLSRLRLEMDRGKSAEAVVRYARPPVFFRQQAAVIRQLQSWSLDALEIAGQTVAHAILQCRLLPALQDDIAGRAFLTIGRLAQGSAR